MAKVFTITYHYSNNVGAMLQAYGLAKAIEDLGHTVSIIDYRPRSMQYSVDGRYPRNPAKLLRVYSYRKRIQSFRKKYLPLTKPVYSPEDIIHSKLDGDCYVCGSDQIWNITSKRGFDPTYFLDFVDVSSRKRISYAPSFGNGTNLGFHKDRIAELLSGFDHLSVRDRVSQKIVKLLTAKEAIRVLDPSFLADYDPITPKPIMAEPYILAYLFKSTKVASKALSKLEEQLGIPVISITTGFNTKYKFNPGPLEWLSLMKYASYVVTNSFHGTCFSLKNQKQFIVVPYDKQGSMHRIEDLLASIKMPEKFISSQHNIEEALRHRIDYGAIGARISTLRKKSITYLESSLST